MLFCSLQPLFSRYPLNAYEFGGEFLRLKSSNVFATIVEVAKTQRITQIVLGETHRSRLELFFKGAIAQRLMRSLPDVDIHLIGDRQVNSA